MRDEAKLVDDPSPVFRGGASTFFYKGTNRRRGDVLTDDDVSLYDAAASTLDPSLRAWLENDRRAAT
jgi:hypothetical protein